MSAGKGDKPRNCHSKAFKENFDKIKWSKKQSNPLNKEVKTKSGKTIYVYTNPR